MEYMIILNIATGSFNTVQVSKSVCVCWFKRTFLEHIHSKMAQITNDLGLVAPKSFDETQNMTDCSSGRQEVYCFSVFMPPTWPQEQNNLGTHNLIPSDPSLEGPLAAQDVTTTEMLLWMVDDCGWFETFIELATTVSEKKLVYTWQPSWPKCPKTARRHTM